MLRKKGRRLGVLSRLPVKRLLTALVVCAYAVPFSAILGLSLTFIKLDFMTSVPVLPAFAPFFLSMPATIAFAVANFRRAVFGDDCAGFAAALAAKLALIPFFVVNFALWGLSMMVFHLALITIMLLPFLVAYAYVLTAATSAHCAANVSRLRRGGAIPGWKANVYTLLLFLFVTDVFAAGALARKFRKKEV